MKVKAGSTSYIYPIPIVLIGTKAKSSPSFTTIGDVGLMGDMLHLVDYCGQVSGRDVDKGMLFDVFYGDLNADPLIQACPVNLECHMAKEFSIQHRQVFIGEVIQTHVDESLDTGVDDRPKVARLGKLAPIRYDLDNRYYSIGESIGIGYQEAGKLEKQ